MAERTETIDSLNRKDLFGGDGSEMNPYYQHLIGPQFEEALPKLASDPEIIKQLETDGQIYIGNLWSTQAERGHNWALARVTLEVEEVRVGDRVKRSQKTLKVDVSIPTEMEETSGYLNLEGVIQAGERGRMIYDEFSISLKPNS